MTVSFFQWRTTFEKNGIVRPVTWLCGPERVLIEEVLDTIVKTVEPSDFDRVSMTAGEDAERYIWAEVEQDSFVGGSRLVVVRRAEQLGRWDRLQQFVKTRAQHPKTHVVFISDLPGPMMVTQGKGRDEKQDLAPHLTALSAGKGHVIECRPLTASSAKSAVPWVKSKVRVRPPVATHLLERSNGDIRLVRDICAKVAVLDTEVTLSMVNEMLAQRPRDEFSEAVVQRDKKSALLALQRLPVGEYSRTLGLLDSQIEFAGMLHDMQAAAATPAEMAEAAGGRRFLIPHVLPVAKGYPPRRRLQIRRVLAMADEAIRSGATTGVMESVVAFI